MEKETLYNGECTLANGLIARLEIVKNGQEKPSESDKVVVEAKLSLPANPTGSELHPELQYRDRLKSIWGEKLTHNWGNHEVSYKIRVNTNHFSGVNWQDATKKALDIFTNQMSMLNDAVTARVNALKNA